MQWGTEAPANCQENVPSLKYILLQSSFQMKVAPADITTVSQNILNQNHPVNCSWIPVS